MFFIQARLRKTLAGLALVLGLAASASAQTELISNGGFESGLSSWTSSGSFFANSGFTCYHGGSRYAYFSLSDGTPANNLSGTLYQQIALPASATNINLSFWRSITSPETGALPFDTMTVTLETTGGSNLATIASYSNLDKGTSSGCASYSQKTFDLTSWKGQTVRIKFTAATDLSLPTVFRIDDVSVQSTSSASPSPTAVPTATPQPTASNTSQPTASPTAVSDCGLSVGQAIEVGNTGAQTLTVRSCAGTSCGVTGSRDDGDTGTIIGGPTVANGYRWWQIDWDNYAVTGWSAEGDASDCWLLPASTPCSAKSVRVSVKFVLNASGNRPSSGAFNTDSEVQGAIGDANDALASLGADWRLDLTEIVDVPGISQWYGPIDCTQKYAMEAAAEADPALYQWRTNAVNIYIISQLTGCGGICSFPAGGDDIIWINTGTGSILNGGIGWLHELGHYFNLTHTHEPGAPPDSCNTYEAAKCLGGSNGCGDICPDRYNVMSYYCGINSGNAELSPCQLAIAAAAMTASRQGVMGCQTPTPTPTPSPTASVSPTQSPSATPSLSPSVSQTASLSASLTASQTASLTPSLTASASPSATPSQTGSLTPSATASQTPSATISATVSPTASATPSFTASFTPSRTASLTPTATAQATASPSPSLTASLTPSFTPSVSVSPSSTQATLTPPLTNSPSITASATPTPTPLPPMIVKQPIGQAANVGQNIALGVEAIGEPPLSYQWFKGTTALAGKTEPTLLLNAVTLSNAGVYHCDVTNPWGVTPSENASLAVFNPPSVNAAAFVEHTVPATMFPGQELWVGFVFENTSALSWSAAQNYELAVIADGSGLFQGISRLTPADTSAIVDPGEIGQFIGLISAPMALGSHTVQLEMVEEFVEFFGAVAIAHVQVVARPNAAKGWEGYE